MNDYEEMVKYFIEEKDQDLVIIKDLDVLIIFVEENIENPLYVATKNEEECRELIAYFLGKEIDKEKIEYFEEFEVIKRKWDYKSIENVKKYVSERNYIFEEIYFGKFEDDWIYRIESDIFEEEVREKIENFEINIGVIRPQGYWDMIMNEVSKFINQNL